MAKAKASNDKKELPAGVKAFRNSSDIENFYRFINDNTLRSEAKALIELALKQIAPAKKKRGRKKMIQ